MIKDTRLSNLETYSLNMHPESIRFHQVERLMYEGREVIYRQAEDDKRKWVNVPGYTTSEPYTDKYGQSAIDIERIADKEDKEEIRKLIRIRVENQGMLIRFWPVETESKSRVREGLKKILSKD